MPIPDDECIEVEGAKGSAMREEVILETPGEAHREREARHKSDRTAGTEKVAKYSPERAGHPWQDGPQVEGETGLNSPRLGGTQHNSRRVDDAEAPGRATAKEGNGAGAFSARARQRVCTTENGPAGREGTPDPRSAPEDRDDQAGKRGRQKMARLVRMHGGLIIEGGR